MGTRLTAPAQAIAVDLTSNSSIQQHSLGTKVETIDGRSFRYVKVGSTALVPGKLYDGPIVSSNYNIAVAAAASAGATQVTVTLGTTVTANQLQDGVLIVNDVDGQGYSYGIKSHPAASAAASCVITLHDPLLVALTTDSQVTLIQNQYNGVVIHATTEAGVPVGVAVTAVTALYYGWIQTRGPVSLLINATTGIGEAVSASDTTNAGGGEVGDGILAPIGYALAPGVATEYNAVFLTID